MVAPVGPANRTRAAVATRLVRAHFVRDLLQQLLHPLFSVLRLTAPVVDVRGREDHEREQLEELGLPVLERRLSELDEELPRAGGLPVITLLLSDRSPFGHGLTSPAHEEQDAQHDAECKVGPDAT